VWYYNSMIELKNKHADICNTPYSIGEGWYDLVDQAFNQIKELLENGAGSITITEIKEKFGELRIYYILEDVHDTDAFAVSQFITEAETLSTRTCEICGEPGKTRDLPYIVTLCDKHYSETDK